jgi:hypothetical protein
MSETRLMFSPVVPERKKREVRNARAEPPVHPNVNDSK